jgi:hypothetical protein
MWGTNYDQAYTMPTMPGRTGNNRYDIQVQNDCIKCETIPSILIIDSYYRDNPISTTPDDYTVTLINKYPDVVSVELIYASIPNSNYNVTAQNNKLHIMPIGPLVKVTGWSGGNDATLVGDTTYTFTSLAAVLPRRSTPTPNDNVILVTRDANGAITAITVIAGGVNWIPGEVVTLGTTSTTPNLAQALTFTVSETTVQTFEIAPGLYTATSLNAAIDLQLATIVVADVAAEDLSGEINADAQIGYPLDNYIMTSTGDAFPFGVKVVSSGTTYMSQTITKMLGFKPANKYSIAVGGDYKLVSDYPVMLEMDHYITMFIEGMERCDGNHSDVHGAFCIVPLDAHQDNFGLFKDSNNIDNDKFVHHYVQPQKLSKLHITFRDWQGNPYDFNGQNHTLIFRVQTATHRKKYQC